jgi:two-component system, LytTR family, response regulator
MIRVLIVDDERLARTGIRRQLSQFGELEVVGECADGDAAVGAIQRLAPDLVILDVQMPERNGFQVIETVGPERMPAVIFLTAHDEHAIRAFEADAVDYLLKPVDPVRLQHAVARALRRLEAGTRDELASRLDALLHRLDRGRPSELERSRIPVEEGGRFHFVDPAEILWVEAAANYVRLHTARGVHSLRSTLDSIEERLGRRFLRVSRSALVNRQAVDVVEPFLKGSFILVLKGGARIRSSRNYRHHLTALLERGS